MHFDLLWFCLTSRKMVKNWKKWNFSEFWISVTRSVRRADQFGHIICLGSCFGFAQHSKKWLKNYESYFLTISRPLIELSISLIGLVENKDHFGHISCLGPCFDFAVHRKKGLETDKSYFLTLSWSFSELWISLTRWVRNVDDFGRITCLNPCFGFTIIAVSRLKLINVC